MTIVNINNYEQFALDYIEGNLDTDTKKSFEEFLAENSKIQKEIEDLFDVSIEPLESTFENKFNLKKSPIEGLSYFEYLAISDIEKTISTEEKNELQTILTQDNEKFKEYKLFSETISKNNNKVFIENSDIKKSPIEGLTYFEYLAISNIEKTITSQEKDELNNILNNNTEKANENKLFENSILIPENITFENKSSLKKSRIFTLKNIQRTVSSIAAILIIFIGIKFINNYITFKNIKHSYANSAIFSSNEIYLRDVQKNDDTEIIPKEKINIWVNNNSIKKDSSKEIIEDNNPSKIVKEEFPIRDNFKVNSDVLPAIQFVHCQSFIPEQNNYNLAYLKKKVNAVTVMNLAFKTFDVMTESELNMKLNVDETKKKIKFDIKEKSFALALR